VKKAKAFFDREVVLIPNGIDTHHFKPMEKNLALAESLKGVILSEAKNLSQVERDSSPSAKAQSDTTPVIGFVGELREKKGLKTLLSAYAQINAAHKTTLLIVGEVRNGEDKQTFEEMRLSIPESQIIVTGYVSPGDLPAYYSLMDVFVHPSLRDGMPNAVLEAMACEIPVIATPVGGTLDILEDGKNGMLININDDKALAEKTLKLIGDRTLRSDLGKQARKVIAEKFTPEKELDANLEIYKKLGLKV
jgi:glycosyltransferase involved in cell wall biosynthesis